MIAAAAPNVLDNAAASSLLDNDPVAAGLFAIIAGVGVVLAQLLDTFLKRRRARRRFERAREAVRRDRSAYCNPQ